MSEMREGAISLEDADIQAMRDRVRKMYVERFGDISSYKMKHLRPFGHKAETRWDVRHKDFKPLRDVLGYSKDEVDLEMHKITSAPDVQQFVLSRELSFEVFKLASSFVDDTEQFKLLAPLAKPPYEKCCVEMVLSEDVASFLQPSDDSDEELRRIGAYIESHEESDGTPLYLMSLYYEYVTGATQTAIVSYAYRNNQDIEGLRPVEMTNLDQTWNVGACPAATNVAKKNNFKIEELIDQYGGMDVVELSIADTVHDIPLMFFSWLFLLNSKSGVVSKKVPSITAPSNYGKRQRMIRSRSGYTIIALDDIEYINDNFLVCERDLPVAHRVRGHFKQKKNGIFWWRPHIRGKGDIHDREGYKVL